MRDDEKPFILYQHGRRSRISPRGAAGWRGFAVWMLALTGLVLAFIYSLSFASSGFAVAALIAVYALALIMWSVAMFRWMKARAEIVDIDELLKLKRSQGASGRLHGRKDSQ